MPRKNLKKWGDSHPKIVNAAANLRISGVSEKAIYERYRTLLKQPPTYRELRAAMKERGVGARKEATAFRQKRQYFKADGTPYTAEKHAGGSRYLERRNDRVANPTPRSREKLVQNTIVGRTLAADPEPSDYTDERVVEFLDSEYEGYPI